MGMGRRKDTREPKKWVPESTYGDSGAVFADSAGENSRKVAGEHEQVNGSRDRERDHFDFDFDARDLMHVTAGQLDPPSAQMGLCLAGGRVQRRT